MFYNIISCFIAHDEITFRISSLASSGTGTGAPGAKPMLCISFLENWKKMSCITVLRLQGTWRHNHLTN